MILPENVNKSPETSKTWINKKRREKHRIRVVKSRRHLTGVAICYPGTGFVPPAPGFANQYSPCTVKHLYDMIQQLACKNKKQKNSYRYSTVTQHLQANERMQYSIL